MNQSPCKTMWKDNKKSNFREFSTPPPPHSKKAWNSAPCTPLQTFEKKKSPQPSKVDSFHIVHKVPNGDSPYVKAKHVQLIDKDPSKAISLFWSAINAGDRVDSALKDMAVVMKQLNRTDEAIEAIKSFRHFCTSEAQESLDNVLIDLYKRGGRTEEHIELLQHKLRLIEEGTAFGGKKIKIARAHGKKFTVSVEQEKSRLLGNLAWAYMVQKKYKAAEELYRKALFIEPDKNKQCNLSICLMNMGRIMEAKSLLQAVIPSSADREMAEPFVKSFDRAHEILLELESGSSPNLHDEMVEEKTDINRSFTIVSPPREEQSMLMEKACSSSVQKQKRGSYSCNPLEHRFDSSGFDKGRWKTDRGFENKGDCHSSGCSLFADKWKKETCSRRLFETGSSNYGFENVGLASNSRIEEICASKNSITFGSPFSINKSRPKFESSEPNCVPQPSSNGDWRKTFWKYDVDKKQEQEIVTIKTPNSREPKSGLRTPAHGDWMRSCDSDVDKKQPIATLTKMPTTRETRYGLQSPAMGDWRKSVNYGTDKTPGTITAHETAGNSQAFSVQRYEVTASDNITRMETSEESSATDFITGESTRKHQDFSCPSFKSGKSWADMVEEEEELLRECMNTSDTTTCEYPHEDTSVSFQSPCKSVDRWNDAEEVFQDENMDSNITSGSTPHPLNSTSCSPESFGTQTWRNDYTRNVQQKLELIDIEERREKSGDSYSCRGSTARRTLPFQKTGFADISSSSPARRALSFQKTDSADIHLPSPSGKKVLFNLGDDDSAVPMEFGQTGHGNVPRDLRNEKKRLQVFQELTF